MKVLFICSGNSQGSPTYLVYNQGESLKREGLFIEYFTIHGKGFFGYLGNVPRLMKFVREKKINLIHAHYSYSAFVASISLFLIFPSSRPKLIVSLLGSDAYIKGWTRIATKLLYKYFWKSTIVKTSKMKQIMGLNKAIVLPNGVDINRFKPKGIIKSRVLLGMNLNRKIIVFIADPSREEKNFALAKEAIRLANKDEIEFIAVHNMPNEAIPDYLNAADLLLLTSKWEGSVNVVKEAMACNTPVVSTDVGDVKFNLEGVSNCYVVSSSGKEIAHAINNVLKTNTRSNGRERIISLELDSTSIAKKIIAIYNDARKK